ncbi:MAG TPA: phage protease, partial [Desulfobaccales bacterium]
MRLDPETRRPTALMHLGLTNVPAIKHLPPLVAKWGGQSGATPSIEENMAMDMEKVRAWLGLGPEVQDGAVVAKLLEVLGELAAALNLPADASASQIKGALAALQAGQASLKESTAELATLKARLKG